MTLSKLFSSPRFWLVIVIGVLQVLVVFKVIDGAQLEALTHILQSVLAGIVAIRTVDRQGDKKVEAAQVAASGSTNV